MTEFQEEEKKLKFHPLGLQFYSFCFRSSHG